MDIKKVALLVVVLVVAAKDLLGQNTLKRYSSHIDRKYASNWLTTGKRRLDINGVVMNNHKYHTLGIAQYGLICYYHFLETKDSTYYHRFINQANYLKDTSNLYKLHNGKSLGLVYEDDFWDMKAPWFSGMTQGYAVSLLLRYREHTKDKSADDVIKKMISLLISPVEEGGCIDRTPEGYLWIEEYPNSKKAEHVLNGYINGLIGLKEYCDVFPEDTYAKQILDSTYLGLTKTLHKYDTKNEWTNYDRGSRKCKDHYIQYEIYEMIHLYELFENEQFLDQMRLYCFYTAKRELRLRKRIFKNYDFKYAEKAVQEGSLITFTKNLPNYTSKMEFDRKQVPLKDTMLLFLKRNEKLTYYVTKNESISLLKLPYELVGETEQTPEFKIKYYSKDLKRIKPSAQLSVDSNVVKSAMNSSHEIRKVELSIKYKKGAQIRFKPLHTTNTIDRFNLPFIVYQRMKGHVVEKKEFKMSFDEKVNAKDIVVFYRWHPNKEAVKNQTWVNFQNIKFEDKIGTFIPESIGYYEFLITYVPTDENSYLSFPKFE